MIHRTSKEGTAHASKEIALTAAGKDKGKQDDKPSDDLDNLNADPSNHADASNAGHRKADTGALLPVSTNANDASVPLLGPAAQSSAIVAPGGAKEKEFSLDRVEEWLSKKMLSSTALQKLTLANILRVVRLLKRLQNVLLHSFPSPFSVGGPIIPNRILCHKVEFAWCCMHDSATWDLVPWVRWAFPMPSMKAS